MITPEDPEVDDDLFRHAPAWPGIVASVLVAGFALAMAASAVTGWLGLR